MPGEGMAPAPLYARSPTRGAPLFLLWPALGQLILVILATGVLLVTRFPVLFESLRSLSRAFFWQLSRFRYHCRALSCRSWRLLFEFFCLLALSVIHHSSRKLRRLFSLVSIRCRISPSSS